MTIALGSTLLVDPLDRLQAIAPEALHRMDINSHI